MNKSEFLLHMLKWNYDTRFKSGNLADHDSYRAIIEAGKEDPNIAAYIFEDWELHAPNYRHWHSALAQIFGVNPLEDKPQNYYNIGTAAERWIEWYENLSESDLKESEV